MTTTKRFKIFTSYAHADELYLLEFRQHLKSLEDEGLIESFNDKAILGGQNWDDKIKQELEKADIILFLLSKDFVWSNYIHDVEIKKALDRYYTQGNILLIPIYIKPYRYSSQLISQFQGFPDPVKPVSLWGEDRDSAWVIVVDGIAKCIKEMQNKVKENHKSKENLNQESTLKPQNGYKRISASKK